jgi:hypothetical protein
MKQTEIFRGNKLIAEFLNENIDEDFINSETAFFESPFKYDIHWGCLMRAVEKIESIEDPYHGRFGVHIVSNSCSIQSTNFRPDKRIPDPPHYASYITGKDKIEATWLAVVEFIKWYSKKTEIN